ncbi:MAG TPA: hypothetical protein VME45_05175 [Stellaceae bacterium]|nr:hypothetical protein [Stellaceae bacterium]
MARFLFPLVLIALGILGLTQSNAINAEWEAMYPEDAAKQDAITRCARENVMFNRLSPDARRGCYQKYLQQPDAPLNFGGSNPPSPAAASPDPGRDDSKQR